MVVKVLNGSLKYFFFTLGRFFLKIARLPKTTQLAILVADTVKLNSHFALHLKLCNILHPVFTSPPTVFGDTLD